MIGSKQTFVRRSQYAARVAALAAGSVLAAAAVQAHPADPPSVPSNLQVPEGHRAFRMWHATGTQNYICMTAGQPWVFIGPQATLFNDDNRQALTHFLSPNPAEGGVARATWQHSRDTSAVWGLSIASSTDPAYVSPGAIPWLLLKVVGTQDGPEDGDKLARATYIQRVNTQGGSAPSPACSTAGGRAFVPYETDYVFYRAR